jgi:hypothetical protein
MIDDIPKETLDRIYKKYGNDLAAFFRDAMKSAIAYGRSKQASRPQRAADAREGEQ